MASDVHADTVLLAGLDLLIDRRVDQEASSGLSRLQQSPTFSFGAVTRQCVLNHIVRADGKEIVLNAFRHL